MTASTKIANFKKLKFKAFFVVFKFKFETNENSFYQFDNE